MNQKNPAGGFTPEEYRRLAKNPFVDKKMLQFVKEKTVSRRAAAIGIPAAPSSASTASGKSAAATGGGAPGAPVISEKTARLVAITLKTMMGQR